MHALRPRALRDLLGIGERRAAQLAHVSRETLRRYEISPDLVKSDAKRWLCQEYYREVADLLVGAERRAKLVDEGLFDGTDTKPNHVQSAGIDAVRPRPLARCAAAEPQKETA